MSKGSKSVSFGAHQKSHNWKHGNSPRNQVEAMEGRQLFEISQLPPPPPPFFEPRDERLLSKRTDPWFGRISNASYIMPSSFGPVLQSKGPKRETLVLPPPPQTPGPEESKLRNSFNHNSISNDPSSVDVIEIKRPGTVSIVRRNNSDCGLAPHYKPIVFFGGGERETAEDSYESEESNTQLNHSCSGIFGLPKIYSPPPLGPVHVQQQVSALSTNSAQLHCLMPSFLEDNNNCNHLKRHQQYGLQKSPRLAFSEPTFTPETDKIIPPQRVVRSEASRLSPRMRNNKTFATSRSGCRESRRPQYQQEQASVMEESKIYPSSDPETVHSFGTEQNSEPMEPINSSRRHRKHDGRGDYEDAVATTSTKLSNHNCLSPRAVKLGRPSVITPAVTESLLCECLDNLKSSHWEDNFEAFSQIYNLTELHPGRVKSILNKVIWHGLPHLSSPRTKLARMACICFKRLYQTQKRSMETEGEKVFYRLLDLCGGMANNFIQQESREALVAAVENLDPLKSLSFLELHGAKHKNPHVREFSAYLLSAIMDELPQNKLMNKEFSPRIIPMIVSFLREGLLQTRLHAKLALDKVFDHSTFESKLKRYVSPENVRHIADTLREFRERRSGHL